MGKAKKINSYKYDKQFVTSLRNLLHKGGTFQKAAEKVERIIARITEPHGIEPLQGCKITSYGEKRIDKCI